MDAMRSCSTQRPAAHQQQRPWQAVTTHHRQLQQQPWQQQQQWACCARGSTATAAAARGSTAAPRGNVVVCASGRHRCLKRASAAALPAAARASARSPAVVASYSGAASSSAPAMMSASLGPEPGHPRRSIVAAAGAAAVEAAAATEHVDYAIVGGGPAGLLAAKALLAAAPGASVKVFEGATGYWPQGAGVLLEINGWRALHAVDDQLADRLRSRGFLFGPIRVLDESGAAMQSPFSGGRWHHEEDVKAHGHTSVMTYWSDIRQTLFEALPSGIVSFNSRVTSITPGQPEGEPAVLEVQENKGAADGGDPTRKVTAGMVVAADGYYSRTKRMVWGSGLPTFINRLIWRALVQYGSDEEVPQLLRESHGDPVMWMGQGVPPSRFATVYTVGNNRFVWTCIAGTSYLEAAGVSWGGPSKHEDMGIHQTGFSGTSPKERCLAVFKDFPPEIVDLLSRTDPRAITEHGAYLHDFTALQGAADWVRGNVVLVGDAAHTAPPDGQGLNMALEDVAVLGECVQRSGATQKALEEYAAARLPRVLDVWLRPPGAVEPPRRFAAIREASFAPLGPGPHSGKSRPPVAAPVVTA